MTLGNSVFGFFKTIFDILFKIKKFAFLEYYKLPVQILEIFNKNKENKRKDSFSSGHFFVICCCE